MGFNSGFKWLIQYDKNYCKMSSASARYSILQNVKRPIGVTSGGQEEEQGGQRPRNIFST